MSRIISIIRLLLLMVSCYGYIREIRKKVKIEFSIGILFTTIGSVMFFAGILNVLEEMTYVVLGGGLILALKSIYKKEKIAELFNIGLMFFFIMSGGMLLILHGSEFTHYDNYSHWAIAVKSLLQNDRFPNFMDVNISFQSYPLGSTSFIYYVTKVVGNGSEWMQMYAQTILMLGMLISVFSFTKRRETNLLLILISIMCLVANVNLTELLVDTLLPITAIGAMVFCIYYKDELQEKVYFVMPYIIYMMTIKNSGIFFVVVILIYLLIHIEKTKKGLQNWCVVALSPILTLVLWRKHVQLVFFAGLTSKHTMTLSRFEKTFGEKNREDISTIVTRFANETISFSNKVVPIILFGIIFYLCLKYLKLAYAKEWKKSFLNVLGVYVLYQVSLLGMYLLSMQGREALLLAEYARYHKTILIFIVVILVMEGIKGIELLVSEINTKKIGFILITLLLCFSFGTLQPKLKYYIKQSSGEQVRTEYEKMLFENGVISGKKYILLADSKVTNSDFYYHLSRYLLNPDEILIYTSEMLLEQNDILSNYDYLIVCDETDETNHFVDQVFGEDKNVICLSEK